MQKLFVADLGCRHILVQVGNGASGQLVEYGLLLPLTGRIWQPHTLRVSIVLEYQTIASHCNEVSFGDDLLSSGLIDFSTNFLPSEFAPHNNALPHNNRCRTTTRCHR